MMDDLPSLYSGFKLKIKRKLRKYQHLLCRETDICVTDDSENLMICNAGLVSGNQREEVVRFFSNYGMLEEVSMPHGKSYSFVKFRTAADALNAFNDVNGQKCLPSSDSCLYLLFVDKIPTISINEDFLPPGLILLEDFISEHEEKILINCVNWSSVDSNQEKCLKHRQVKHYGYEFRYSDNNVDQNAPLDENIPQECDFLFQRLITKTDKFLSWTPDQLTINKYEPGQGIPPHIDTHSAFNEPILSLSLGSPIVMDWKHKDGRRSSVLLPQRSLLIMSAESRYAWTHGITPRKTDVVKSPDSALTVHNRDVRVSFTFRQLRRNGPCNCEWPDCCDSQLSKSTNPGVDDLTDDLAAKLETTYVHQVYDVIASHFSETRHKPWPNVLDFVMSLEPGAILLDVGCGNGKYFGYNKSLIEIGCDRSFNLINVCLERGFQVFQCDCLSLPLCSSVVDACISIAVIHHLSTLDRRKQAISEIIRILKPKGRALIYVWAKDQNRNEMSSYLKQDRKNRKKSKNDLAVVTLNKMINLSEINELHINDKKNSDTVHHESSRSNVSLPVHSNRSNFQCNDLLVPWILKQGESKESDSAPTYLRFYHVFEEGELESLCHAIENCKVVKCFYDQGNWCIILEKT